MTTILISVKTLILCFLLLLVGTVAKAQSMDEKVKALANEIADQVVRNGKKKVAVASLLYKDCSTEFGNILAEKLTGRLAVSGRSITVVNQRLLESLLAQNKLSVTGILETKNEAAKLGQVSGIDALVYGTISGSDEEVQLTLNIITLTTLNVFGFAETSFPLTNGIKKMLPCIESDNSNSLNNSDNSTKIICEAKNTAGATITLRECIFSGRTITCHLLITNNRQDKADAEFEYNMYQAYIITDTRRQYGASRISVGNTGLRPGIANAGYTAMSGVEVNGKVEFDVEDSSVTKLQIFEMKDQGLRCLNVPITSSGQTGKR